MKPSQQAASSPEAGGRNGERRSNRAVGDEPLIVLGPELLPLDPEDERRAVELLAELLASLLERPAGGSPIHDE